jgi:outer membrane protein
MPKIQIIISILAVALIFGMYSLPKVVLDNERNMASQEEEHFEGDGHDHNSEGETTTMMGAVHDREINEEEKLRIDNLRENYKNSKEKEKSAKFADSLALVFRTVSKYDSAAKYSEIVAEIIPNEENFLKAGDNYFDAFSYSVEPGVMSRYGENARNFYQKILESRPGRLDIKNKMAMTYVATSNPMQGIILLREVLESDPVNEQAMFNLGILSIQSRQYDKAIERLEKLVTIYPENLQAQFYLAVSYFESGEKQKAKKLFEQVKLKDNDPALQATLDSYLEEIN